MKVLYRQVLKPGGHGGYRMPGYRLFRAFWAWM